MRSELRKAIPLLLAAALVVAACAGEVSESATTVATTTVTTAPSTVTATTSNPPTTTTTEAVPSPEEMASLDAALGVKDSFFVAFNAGDSTTVMGLFTVDAEFATFGRGDRQWFEELLEWNTAQGTRYTPSDCSAEADAETSAIVVSCPFVTHNAMSIASGGPPVPFTMSMLITPDGIARYQDRFGNPDFNVVDVPFDRWMEQYYPEDVESIEFGSWESIEEAATIGTLIAGYAAEWGRFLETNGCAYNESC